MAACSLKIVCISSALWFAAASGCAKPAPVPSVAANPCDQRVALMEKRLEAAKDLSQSQNMAGPALVNPPAAKAAKPLTPGFMAAFTQTFVTFDGEERLPFQDAKALVATIRSGFERHVATRKILEPGREQEKSIRLAIDAAVPTSLASAVAASLETDFAVAVVTKVAPHPYSQLLPDKYPSNVSDLESKLNAEPEFDVQAQLLEAASEHLFTRCPATEAELQQPADELVLAAAKRCGCTTLDVDMAEFLALRALGFWGPFFNEMPFPKSPPKACADAAVFSEWLSCAGGGG